MEGSVEDAAWAGCIWGVCVEDAACSGYARLYISFSHHDP